MGLLFTFALTGFHGYTLGPILAMFAGANAMHLVTNALGLTAFVFFGLSAYALVTCKDFSFWGFITIGVFVLLGAMLIGFCPHSRFTIGDLCGFVLFFFCGYPLSNQRNHPLVGRQTTSQQR